MFHEVIIVKSNICSYLRTYFKLRVSTVVSPHDIHIYVHSLTSALQSTFPDSPSHRKVSSAGHPAIRFVRFLALPDNSKALN
jgi:hypothetical protein